MRLYKRRDRVNMKILCAIMKRAESALLARQTLHYYNNAGARSVSKTCNYFVDLGYRYTSIHRILKRSLARGTSELFPQRGRPRTVSTAVNLEKVRDGFQTKKFRSVRDAARQLRIKRSTLSDIKVHDLGLKSYVKQVVPKHRNGQQERARTATRSKKCKNF